MASATKTKGPAMVCVMCSKPPELSCPCLERYYCSRDCQRVDWKEKGHKTACKNFNTVRKVAPATSSRITPPSIGSLSTPHTGVKYEPTVSNTKPRPTANDVSQDVALATTTPRVPKRDTSSQNRPKNSTAQATTEIDSESTENSASAEKTTAAIDSKSAKTPDSHPTHPEVSSDDVSIAENQTSVKGTGEHDDDKRKNEMREDGEVETTADADPAAKTTDRELPMGGGDEVPEKKDLGQHGVTHGVMADGAGTHPHLLKASEPEITEHRTVGGLQDTTHGVTKKVDSISKEPGDETVGERAHRMHEHASTATVGHVTQHAATLTDMPLEDSNLLHKDIGSTERVDTGRVEVMDEGFEGYRYTESRRETERKRAKKGPSMSEAFSGGWGEDFKRSQSMGARRVRSKSVSRSSTDNCGGRLARAKSVSHIPSSREEEVKASISVNKREFAIRNQLKREATRAKSIASKRSGSVGRTITPLIDQTMHGSNDLRDQTKGLDSARTDEADVDMLNELPTNSQAEAVKGAEFGNQNVAPPTNVTHARHKERTQANNGKITNEKTQKARDPAKTATVRATRTASMPSKVDIKDIAVDNEGIAHIQLDDWQQNLGVEQACSAKESTKSTDRVTPRGSVEDSVCDTDVNPSDSSKIGEGNMGVEIADAANVITKGTRGDRVEKTTKHTAKKVVKNVADDQVDTTTFDVTAEGASSINTVRVERESANAIVYEEAHDLGVRSTVENTEHANDKVALISNPKKHTDKEVEEADLDEHSRRSNKRAAAAPPRIKKSKVLKESAPEPATDEPTKSGTNPVVEEEFENFVRELAQKSSLRSRSASVQDLRALPDNIVPQIDVDDHKGDETIATGKPKSKRKHVKSGRYAKRKADTTDKTDSIVSVDQSTGEAASTTNQADADEKSAKAIRSAKAGKYSPRAKRSANPKFNTSMEYEGAAEEPLVELSSGDEADIVQAKQRESRGGKQEKVRVPNIKAAKTKGTTSKQAAFNTDDKKMKDRAQKRKANGKGPSRARAPTATGGSEASESEDSESEDKSDRLAEEAAKGRRKKNELAKLGHGESNPAHVLTVSTGRLTRSRDGDATELLIAPSKTTTLTAEINTDGKTNGKSSGKTVKSKASEMTAKKKVSAKRNSEACSDNESKVQTKQSTKSTKHTTRPQAHKRKLPQADESPIPAVKKSIKPQHTARKRARANNGSDDESDSRNTGMHKGDKVHPKNRASAADTKASKSKNRVSNRNRTPRTFLTYPCPAGSPAGIDTDSDDSIASNSMAEKSEEASRARAHVHGDVTKSDSGTDISDLDLDCDESSTSDDDDGDSDNRDLNDDPTTSETLYKCAEKSCGKHFAFNGQLIAHSKSKHGLQITFPCLYDSCTLSYKHRTDLNVHVMVSHLHMRPFKCKFANCVERFASEHDRYVHTRTHVQEMYSCKWNGCLSSFKSREKRSRHMSQHKAQKK